MDGTTIESFGRLGVDPPAQGGGAAAGGYPALEAGGGGDEDVGVVLRRQAAELARALSTNGDLEAEAHRLGLEVSALQTRLANKESELKKAESQARQKDSRIAALEQSLGGGAEGGGRGMMTVAADDSAELMDVKAERDALQEALRAAQQELARETARASTLEAKVAALGSQPAAAPGPDPAELEALQEQLEAEQVEVAALQESLRRAELEWGSANKDAVALREALDRAEAQAADAAERADGLQEQARSLQRMLAAKDEAIQELTDKLERGLMDRIQFGEGGSGAGDKDMWQLGLTNEQMEAIDGIVTKWREGYARKEGELGEALGGLQELEDQVGRIGGIVRRAMESIRSSYLRSSGGAGGGSPPQHQRNPEEAAKDEAMLDASRFETPEEMLGSLAQFAANKSHAVLRLEQEVARKEAELQRMDAELQKSWAAGRREQELEEARQELDEKAAECAELRVSLSRRSEEAAAAQVEVRVLHEEVNAAREQAQHLRAQLEDAEDDVVRTRQEVSDLALADVARLREELEKSHAEVLPLKEQLNRRTREVRELNHMLKAWEAMRLGKDAQIASLMERCKRHEEEAAEKARSVDSLRRKLALAGTGAEAAGGSGSGTPTGRRARHIHVHMHHQPTSEAGSDYGGLGSTLTGDYGAPSAYGNSSFASGPSSLQASHNF